MCNAKPIRTSKYFDILNLTITVHSFCNYFIRVHYSICNVEFRRWPGERGGHSFSEQLNIQSPPPPENLSFCIFNGKKVLLPQLYNVPPRSTEVLPGEKCLNSTLSCPYASLIVHLQSHKAILLFYNI